MNENQHNNKRRSVYKDDDYIREIGSRKIDYNNLLYNGKDDIILNEIEYDNSSIFRYIRRD